MIKINAMRIDTQISNNEYKNLLSVINNEKRRKIQCYYHYDDRKRSLYGDILARKMLAECYNININEIAYEYNENGKPKYKNINYVNFNISHADVWVICAISDKNIGVDIEKVKSIDDILMESVCSIEEYELLCTLSIEQKLYYFYRLWTLKESYLKYLGKGICFGLKDKSFFISNECVFLRNDKNKLIFTELSIENGYVSSICAEESLLNSVNILNIKDILCELF